MKTLLKLLVCLVCVTSLQGSDPAPRDGDRYTGALDSKHIHNWNARSIWKSLDKKKIYKILMQCPAAGRLQKCLVEKLNESASDLQAMSLWIERGSEIRTWAPAQRMVIGGLAGLILISRGEEIDETPYKDAFHQLDEVLKNLGLMACPVCKKPADTFIAERGKPVTILTLTACGHAMCDWCQEQRVDNDGNIRCGVCPKQNRSLLPAIEKAKAAAGITSGGACAAASAWGDALLEEAFNEMCLSEASAPSFEDRIKAQLVQEGALFLETSTSAAAERSRAGMQLYLEKARSEYQWSTECRNGITLADVLAKTKNDGHLGIGLQQALERQRMKFSTCFQSAGRWFACQLPSSATGTVTAQIMVELPNTIHIRPSDKTCYTCGNADKQRGFAHCSTCLTVLGVD